MGWDGGQRGIRATGELLLVIANFRPLMTSVLGVHVLVRQYVPPSQTCPDD